MFSHQIEVPGCHGFAVIYICVLNILINTPILYAGPEREGVVFGERGAPSWQIYTKESAFSTFLEPEKIRN